MKNLKKSLLKSRQKKKRKKYGGLLQQDINEILMSGCVPLDKRKNCVHVAWSVMRQNPQKWGVEEAFFKVPWRLLDRSTATRKRHPKSLGMGWFPYYHLRSVHVPTGQVVDFTEEFGLLGQTFPCFSKRTFTSADWDDLVVAAKRGDIPSDRCLLWYFRDPQGFEDTIDEIWNDWHATSLAAEFGDLVFCEGSIGFVYGSMRFEPNNPKDHIAGFAPEWFYDLKGFDWMMNWDTEDPEGQRGFEAA